MLSAPATKELHFADVVKMVAVLQMPNVSDSCEPEDPFPKMYTG